ncbi:MAG: HAD-IA family hydrolase, partial [Proteobacteria bacterium]|nr:HAD-IA family hydrolase [Pseudomonadota bacterium]
MKPVILKPFCIKAVLFDFDGTLTRPGALDFPLLKQTIGCPPEALVLEFIQSLPTAARQKEARDVLERFERNAAENSKPNVGAEDLVAYLRSKGIALGIITRNTLDSINRAFQNFNTIGVSDFDLIITRETPVKRKPNPDGILLAAQKLKVDVGQLLMVGDFFFDIQAGQEAGSLTAFLDNGVNSGPSKIASDFRISRLEELKTIVRFGSPLSMGKLPNDILEMFLQEFDFQDASVLIPPGIGEDTAAVNVQETEVLVLKSDPITFVTDSIGHYAVLINANDIATAGAIPRWLLTTLLFP